MPPEIIARFDRKYRYLYISPAVEAALGYPPSFFLGRTPAEVGMPREEYPAWSLAVEEVFHTQEERELPFIFETPRGRRELTIRLAPETDAEGRVSGFVGIIADRTWAEEALHDRERELRRLNTSLEERVTARTREYVRAIQDLEFANRTLENRNRELQEFAYVASHDLQEPLRKISTFATMLRTESGDALGEQSAYYLDRVEHAATRMLILIRDLLAFSRVQTSGDVFRRIDLGKIAREVLTDLEVAIKESGAEVDLGKMPTLEADPLQMRQLFQNLIGNAIKFRRPDVPPRIRIWGWTEEWLYDGITQSQPLAFVQVEDNGIGFEEKYVEKIFMPFQRLHGKGQYEGTGMGLAICRRIAERHGGAITARSEPGRGSTFVIRLPVSHAPEAKPEPATAAQE